MESLRPSMVRKASPIQCIFFDCDNTICLSESLASDASRDLLTEILGDFGGISPAAQPALKHVLMDSAGRSLRSVLNVLRDRYPGILTAEKIDFYVDRELSLVTEKLKQECQPCPGAPEQIAWAKNQGYRIAIVSSSAKTRLLASIEKIGVASYFRHCDIFSAADSMEMPLGKPDPAVYNFACQVGLLVSYFPYGSSLP
ncbi:hypothetical protein DL770_005216 [Monosporascus sp. CRB-9-2]|nr:hypothetical protein DL770_005216 [Monosporascus sp. CRB-9-2]